MKFPFLKSISSIFLVTVLFLFSCKPDAEEAQELANMHKVLPETGRNIEIWQTENAINTIKISADKMERYEADIPYMIFPQGMNIYVYDKEGNIASVLRAGYGRVTEGSSEMIAEQDVIVTNSEGEQLNTEHLIWDQEAQKIRSESYVKISTADEIIYGTGFESDENFTNYQIDSISGIVTVKDTEI